ncbi:MAG: hypothetical protein RJA70_50 [Pseudomonadota bacterium]|jgi:cytochrome c553
MKTLNWLIPCAISAAVVACGGGQKPAEDPAGEKSEAATASEGAATKKYTDMNREERMEFMGLVVLPEMQKLFVEYDAEGYKEFKCQTCHGQDMKAVDFKMPNGLFALPEEKLIETSTDYDAEMTKFMMDKVGPKMGELLHKPFGTEFTCLSCHETEK